MHEGLRDSAFTFASRIGASLLTLATEACLAWFLGPGDRGILAICIVAAGLLQMFFLIGCDVASLYYVASRKLSLSEAVSGTAILILAGSILAAIVGASLVYMQVGFFGRAAPSLFYLAFLSAAFSKAALIVCLILTALGEFRYYMIFSLFQGAGRLFITLLLVGPAHDGIYGAIWALIVSNLAILLVVGGFLRRRHGLQLVMPSMSHVWQMLTYGSRYYIGKISNMVNYELGTLILAFFAPADQIGLFAVASGLTSRIEMIPDTLVTVLMPRTASANEGAKKVVARCARFTGIVCIPILAVLALFARPVVELLFSPAFGGAACLVQILCIGLSVRCVSKVFVPYLLGRDHPGAASLSVAVGVTVNLFALLLLMPWLGLAGAAVATTLGYFASSVLLTLFFHKYSRMTSGEIWLFKRDDWQPLLPFVIRLRRCEAVK